MVIPPLRKACMFPHAQPMGLSSVFLTAMVWFAIVPGICGATEPRTPACGEVIREDTMLAADLTCARRGLEIGSDGVTLDCNGHMIDVGTQFGDIVVAMYGRRGVTIQNCVLINSYSGIVAFDSPDLLIRDVVLRDHRDAGVVASSSPRLRIEDSEFSGNVWQARLWECPDAILRGNSFVGPRWGYGIAVSDVDCAGCPRLRFQDNVTPTGVYLSLRSRADDSVISRNTLSGPSAIRISRSVGPRVIDNVMGSAVVGPPGSSSIAFAGVSEGEIRGNRIMQPRLSGSAIYLVPAVEGYEGAGPTQYSNGNSVQDNRIESGFSGIHLQNASDNLLAGNTIEKSAVGVFVEAWPDPEPRPTGNRLELNDIRDVGYGIWLTDDNDTVVWRSDLEVTTFGIGTLNSRGLRVEESRIRGASVGVWRVRLPIQTTC